MFAADLAAVNALDKAATDLYAKGHYARAAEKFGVAVAAAQALGHADCLVTATLQLEEADAWISHACAPGVTKADKDAAMARTLHLMDAAVPTLECRRAAGTLLAGACRPLEEAWFAWFAAGWNLAQPSRERCSDWPWQAQLVGYDAYLLAAHGALRLALAMVFEMGALEKAQRLVTFAVSAVDMMAQPRCHSDMATGAEVPLFRIMQALQDGNMFQSAPMLHATLQDAWSRLQRSGVLRERRIDVAGDALAVDVFASIAANKKRIASAVLRGCALEACAAREVHPAQFKKCAACQAAVYCCKAHQEQHWPAHKVACKAARKAAAEGGAGPSSGSA
jgi:hypothetical protein